MSRQTATAGAVTQMAAQGLADQLSQVEEMEARLERMLEIGEGR